MATQLPTFFLNHGGGPWPYMTGEVRSRFERLESSLKAFPRQAGANPKGILVVSGHWEESDFAVMASPSPPMVHDTRGFRDDLDRIRYPAPGSRNLARLVRALIREAGLPAHMDVARGFDEGTYSILAVSHPEANIPVIQVSIRSDYDPQSHLELGRALAPLRDDGILIIGSGSSYHNLHPRHPRDESAKFDAWLEETLVQSSPERRSQRLVEWDRAPAARAAHPREDHLIPLLVAVGAAEEEPGRVVYREENFLGSIVLSSYRFGS